MRQRLTISIIVLMLSFGCIASTSSQGVRAEAAIVGEWLGTSTCVNRDLAPSCNDETIHYVFTVVHGSPAVVHQLAEKRVGDTFAVMGEIDLTYSSAASSWRYDFEAQQMKLRWEYRIDGNNLSGTLSRLPTGERIRVVDAHRVATGTPRAAH